MLKAFDLQVGHYYGGLGSLARRGEERPSTASAGLSIDESDAVAAEWVQALHDYSLDPVLVAAAGCGGGSSLSTVPEEPSKMAVEEGRAVWRRSGRAVEGGQSGGGPA